MATSPEARGAGDEVEVEVVASDAVYGVNKDEMEASWNVQPPDMGSNLDLGENNDDALALGDTLPDMQRTDRSNLTAPLQDSTKREGSPGMSRTFTKGVPKTASTKGLPTKHSPDSMSGPLHETNASMMEMMTGIDAVQLKAARTDDASEQEGVNVEQEGWDLVRSDDARALMDKIAVYFATNAAEGVTPYAQGIFGESMLHYALLCHSYKVAACLIKDTRINLKLLSDMYGPDTGVEMTPLMEEYDGEGNVHLLVANHETGFCEVLLNECKKNGVPINNRDLELLVRPFRAFKAEPENQGKTEEEILLAWANKAMDENKRLWGVEITEEVDEFHISTGTRRETKLVSKWQFWEDTDLDKDPEIYTRDTPILEQRVRGRFFRGFGEDTVYYGQTALCWAVARRQMDMMRVLIKAGATLQTNDMYSNSIFHHCALYGTPKIWDVLVVAKIVEDKRIEHHEHHDSSLTDTRASFDAKQIVEYLDAQDNPEDEEDTNEDEEMRYKAESAIRKYYNRAGMNPLQFACFCNNKRVFKKIIITAHKIKLWQWGDKANFSYMLNGIDSFHKLDGKPEDYEGVDVLTIINCEGLFDFMDFPIIQRLVKNKLDKWGYMYLNCCLFLQLAYCMILSIVTHHLAPNFADRDNTDPWGYEAITSTANKIMIFWVIIKSIFEFVIQALEWFALVRSFKFQRGTQVFFETSFSAGGWFNRVVQGIRKCSLSPPQTTLKFLDMMVQRSQRTQEWSDKVYESKADAKKDQKEQKEEENKDEADDEDEHPAADDYVSVTGLFQKIRFFASLSSVLMLLQSGSYDSKNPHESTNAKIFCLNLLLLLICEWLLLFMYTQHFPGIARFIASLVTMISNDISGFFVVYGIILLAFASVFVVLSGGGWGDLLYAILEITIGTGEFYFDDENSWSPGNAEGFAKGVTLVFYAIYMVTMILVMLNLLIAVMSETAMTILSDTFENRKKLMASSAVLMMERRVTVVQYWLGQFLYYCRLCFPCKKCPRKTRYKSRHPWVRSLYKRTGVPGESLLEMIGFQSEDLQEELKHSYTLSVIEDVTIAAATAHKYADMTIDQILALDDDDDDDAKTDRAGRAPRVGTGHESGSGVLNLGSGVLDSGDLSPALARATSSPRRKKKAVKAPGFSPRGKLQRKESFGGKKKGDRKSSSGKGASSPKNKKYTTSWS